MSGNGDHCIARGSLFFLFCLNYKTLHDARRCTKEARISSGENGRTCLKDINILPPWMLPLQNALKKHLPK